MVHIYFLKSASLSSKKCKWKLRSRLAITLWLDIQIRVVSGAGPSAMCNHDGTAVINVSCTVLRNVTQTIWWQDGNPPISLLLTGSSSHWDSLIASFMGPTWGRQDPGEPHVGHMNLAIWVKHLCTIYGFVILRVTFAVAFLYDPAFPRRDLVNWVLYLLRSSHKKLT